ncbi:molybdopterin/thiamine biosynthesis adenylyltransferase [Peribacillus deserti]|uniref:Molybdopterin/thiamine biosynthesis adenylyltransferase n=1 Tax=Peribacillus deserti TaxID=673318 RepID=A0ABS2QD67_9BACI|nr:MoeB/ThiF family adenylyltransferase [Peribacillus deserti]MBM7690619.1 molybdopterin/thiamine biosynthesis adenylyltransferase [Peribacillus deserti]
MSERYSRQILFSGIGEQGQHKLAAKHVLLIGAGALGSANAELLVRAGIGKLTIVDRDYVEESNLQRQQLYTEKDVEQKMPKAAAAKKHLEEINSDTEVHVHIMDATSQSLEPLLQNADLLMDATDNFETRLVINDLAHKYNIPWIFGACVGSFGISFTVIPGKTPCLNCLLRAIPLQGMTCETAGIIGPAVQMTVAYQSAEALKILTENREVLRETFVSFDLWSGQFHNIKTGKSKKADCLTCGSDPSYPFLQLENTTKTAVLCGRETVQVRPPYAVELELERLVRDFSAMGYEVKANPYLVSAQNENERIVVFKDGRALVHGTKDVIHAKSVYQKIMG